MLEKVTRQLGWATIQRDPEYFPSSLVSGPAEASWLLLEQIEQAHPNHPGMD